MCHVPFVGSRIHEPPHSDSKSQLTNDTQLTDICPLHCSKQNDINLWIIQWSFLQLKYVRLYHKIHHTYCTHTSIRRSLTCSLSKNSQIIPFTLNSYIALGGLSRLHPRCINACYLPWPTTSIVQTWWTDGLGAVLFPPTLLAAPEESHAITRSLLHKQIPKIRDHKGLKTLQP